MGQHERRTGRSRYATAITVPKGQYIQRVSASEYKDAGKHGAFERVYQPKGELCRTPKAQSVLSQCLLNTGLQLSTSIFIPTHPTGLPVSGCFTGAFGWADKHTIADVSAQIARFTPVATALYFRRVLTRDCLRSLSVLAGRTHPSSGISPSTSPSRARTPSDGLALPSA